MLSRKGYSILAGLLKGFVHLNRGSASDAGPFRPRQSPQTPIWTRQMTTDSPSALPPDLERPIASHLARDLPMQARRWRYYRNPSVPGRGDACPAQAQGLPERLQPAEGRSREIVIENDIAWRVHTLVDFMFGKPLELTPQVSDPQRADAIRRFLRAVIEVNGGVNLFQDAAYRHGVRPCRPAVACAWRRAVQPR